MHQMVGFVKILAFGVLVIIVICIEIYLRDANVPVYIMLYICLCYFLNQLASLYHFFLTRVEANFGMDDVIR